MIVTAVKVQKRYDPFDIYDIIVESLKEQGVDLQDGDVLVISSKFAAVSQGRMLRLDSIRPADYAKTLAKKYSIDDRTAEVIWRESDHILGGMMGFVMADIDGVLAPNAGIDRSNAKGHSVILYPKDPYRLAEEIKRKILLDRSIHVGVIISDSRLMPARAGTVAIALSCAGIEPVNDMRAQPDLDGQPLKVTFCATADSIASAANHAMGEGAESRPIAVVRNSGATLTDRRITGDTMIVPRQQCVYIRSLTG